MTRSRPLGFLVLLIGTWAAGRIAVVAPWGDGGPGAPAVAPFLVAPAVAALPRAPAPAMRPAPATVSSPPPSRPAPIRERSPLPAAPPAFASPPVSLAEAILVQPRSAAPPMLMPGGATGALPAGDDLRRPPAARADRWSLAAFAFVRGGGEPALAAGGTLGGSQAGMRALGRIAPGLAVSVRAYAPLATRGAEVAAGLDWEPLAGVHLLAERRQRVDRGGRSAWSALGYGGVSRPRLAGPVGLDAYLQAGIVGLRRLDPFVDGAARLSVPLGSRLEAGAGLWGAAQPGAGRVDVGPVLRLRLPDSPVTLAADYRVRVAGDAAPGSGPSLTLAADF